MYLTVKATITSVHIGKQARRNARMVKGRIEYGLLLRIIRLNIYLAQIIIPVTAGISLYLLKIPSGNLCQILCRSFRIYRRKGHLDQYLLILGCRKMQQRLLHRQGALSFRPEDGIGQDFTSKRFGEHRPEIDIMPPCPAVGVFISADCRIIHHFQRKGTVVLPLQRVVQIKDKAGLTAFGKSVAMQCRS